MSLFHLGNSTRLTALLVIAALTTSCAEDTQKQGQHGTFLFPKNEQYAVVILQGTFLEQAFGPGWQRRRLYYGYSGGFSEGVELATSPQPLSMLSPHPPVMVIAGNRWNANLAVLVYDSEANEQVTISIDMIKPAVGLKSPLRKREGHTQEQFLGDGRLTFRRP